MVNFRDYMAQMRSKKSGYLTYRVTIAQGFETYLDTKRKQLSPISFLRYRIVIGNFKRFLAIKYPSLDYFDQIEEGHISDFVNYRTDEEGVAHRTANFERDTLSNVFKFLIEEKNCLTHNPVRRIKPLSVPEPDEFFYTKEQVNLILETSKVFSKRINWHAVFATLLFTGMRRNELRFLTWNDIDFARKKIYIRPKQVTPTLFFKPKTRELRDIPLHQELFPALQSLLHKSDKWVFVNSVGNFLSVDVIRQEFRKICKVAGLPVKALHKTRHTWASLSTEAEVPLDVIQAIGGWKDPKTMEKYKHLADNYKSKVFKERFTLKEHKDEVFIGSLTAQIKVDNVQNIC
ncbi:MAG: tyrosine-type recombinase/integrase [Candidatus Omnitrophica bacterium]|nr:tyrosine-type recombinase/integrase [Candidatus Omnitrophota bacterium]